MPVPSTVAPEPASNLREHQLGQLIAGHPAQGLVHVDQALVDELARHHERRGRGPLAHAGLQHPQPPALDRELDVAHVAVALLQRRHDLHQAVERRRVELLELGQRHRVADAGDDVLALGVGQVVTVDAALAGGRVAGEGDAGARVGAQVAEHHRHDVDRGAQAVRNVLAAPVEPGARRVPRVEDGVDRQVELLARGLRELPAGLLADHALVGRDDLLQVGRVQVQVVDGAAGLLDGVEHRVEMFALDPENGLAEHLDQAPVGVPREPLVVGGLREPDHRTVVQADVQDGLHHSGHRELRPRPDRDEQGVLGGAEGLAHGLLEGDEVLVHLRGQLRGEGSGVEVGAARLGADDEPGRHGQAHPGHLRKVRALTAEQILEILVPLGERIHVLRHIVLPETVRRRARSVPGRRRQPLNRA